MNGRIVYLMSGPSHLMNLVCSLYTLRRQTRLPVYVYAWPESYEIARRIGADARTFAEVRRRDPGDEVRSYRKTSQFLDKIRLVRSFRGEVAVAMYLDADTLVHADPRPLLEAARKHRFATTQFNNWTSQKRTISRRVKRLYEFPAIPRKLIDNTLARSWPSVNGGVWAARPESPVLPLWDEWTVEARSIFIADETVLHVLQAGFYEVSDEWITFTGGRWNCSPKFQPKDLADEDVVIRHFHGDSNTRPKKSPRGIELWWPTYRECMRENVGGMAEWRASVKNRWLDPLEAELYRRRPETVGELRRHLEEIAACGK
jgi:hypothetical protein